MVVAWFWWGHNRQKNIASRARERIGCDVSLQLWDPKQYAESGKIIFNFCIAKP